MAKKPILDLKAPEKLRRIDLSPAERAGFAFLRQQEVALAKQLQECAAGALQARQVVPTDRYVAVRDDTGCIVAFELEVPDATSAGS